MKRTKSLTNLLIAVALMTSASFVAFAADAEEEKIDIKNPKDIHEVMESSHKGRTSIAARVRNGEGTKEDIEILVIHYGVLAKSEPPQGDKEEWNKKTTELVRTIKNLQDGKPNALAEYKEAANCKACHDVFRPE